MCVAIDWGEPTLWGAERNHVHLRLTTVLPPQQRRKSRQGGSSGPLLHPDRGQHARNIKQQLAAVRERHKRRAKIFGIDPDLVVVVIFYSDLSGVDEQLEKVGVSFLTSSERQAVGAFPSKTEMNEFLRHLTLFEQGVPPGNKVAHYEEFFDKIKKVRLLEPGDILDPDVQQEAAPEPRCDRLGRGYLPPPRVHLRGRTEEVGLPAVVPGESDESLGDCAHGVHVDHAQLVGQWLVSWQGQLDRLAKTWPRAVVVVASRARRFTCSSTSPTAGGVCGLSSP